MDRSDEAGEDIGYSVPAIQSFESIFGEGFLSPAGAALPWMLEGISVEGLDVLDVGCGTGGPGLELVVGHGARRVDGVDIGAYQVERARARAEQAGLADRIHFSQIGPGGLPGLDAAWEVVFSADVMVHVEDKARMYAEMHRVLKPGGRLVVSDHLRSDDPADAPRVDACWRAGEMVAHPITAAATTGLLEAAGFSEIQLRDLALPPAAPPDAPPPAAAHGPPSLQSFIDDYSALIATGAVRIVCFHARRP